MPTKKKSSKKNTTTVVRNAKTGKFAKKSKAKSSPAKHIVDTVPVSKRNKKHTIKFKDTDKDAYDCDEFNQGIDFPN